jgi:glycosyltransferase involved in cell wall biosynthesis
MNKLSIIEFTSPGENWGGIEQHIKDLGRGLKERGHRVVFASRPMPHAVEKLSEVGEVYTYPMVNALDLKTITGVADLIRKQQADIVHAHTSRDAWMALFATIVAGRGKAVSTRHVPLPAKTDILHRWFYNRLAAIICVSRYVRDIFLSSALPIPSEKVVVAYPSINLTKFGTESPSKLRNRWQIDDDRFVIGYVGRVTVEKGIDDLITAAGILKEQLSNFTLVIVGQVNADTPEYLDKLKAAVTAVGLDGQVLFTGFTTDVVGVMQAIDCLVLPAIIPETFGLVLCEAMAAGKPAIATTTGAQKEIIEDGVNGYLVPPGNPTALAEAIGRLGTHRERASRMGQAGRDAVLARFGPDSTVTVVENCFRQVVKHR